MYLIWSYSHSMWWAPYKCGYVDDVGDAGEYSALEAGDIITTSLMLTTVAIHVETLRLKYDNQPPKFHPYNGEVI